MGFRSSRSDQGASPLEPDRQGAGAEYLRSGTGVSPFPPGGGGSGRDRHGYTGAAHRSGRRKACFFPGMTSTAKPHGGMKGGAHEKYPQLLGFAQKSRGPWPKGGNFLGRGHSLRLLPPEVTRGTSRC